MVIPRPVAPRLGQQGLAAPQISPAVASSEAAAGDAVAGGVARLGFGLNRHKAMVDGMKAREALRGFRNARLEARSNAEGTGFAQQSPDGLLASYDAFMSDLSQRREQAFNGLSPSQQAIVQEDFAREFDDFKAGLDVAYGNAVNVKRLEDYSGEMQSLVDTAAHDALYSAIYNPTTGELETGTVDNGLAQLDLVVDGLAQEMPFALPGPGTPSEWAAEEKARWRAATHGHVVEKMLEGGDADAAQAYLAKYGDEMPEAARSAMGEIVGESLAVQRSLEISDQAYDPRKLRALTTAAGQRALDGMTPERYREQSLRDLREALRENGITGEELADTVAAKRKEFDAQLGDLRAAQDRELEELREQIDANDLTPRELREMLPALQGSLTRAQIRDLRASMDEARDTEAGQALYAELWGEIHSPHREVRLKALERNPHTYTYQLRGTVGDAAFERLVSDWDRLQKGELEAIGAGSAVVDQVRAEYLAARGFDDDSATPADRAAAIIEWEAGVERFRAAHENRDPTGPEAYSEVFLPGLDQAPMTSAGVAIPIPSGNTSWGTVTTDDITPDFVALLNVRHQESVRALAWEVERDPEATGDNERELSARIRDWALYRRRSLTASEAGWPSWAAGYGPQAGSRPGAVPPAVIRGRSPEDAQRLEATRQRLSGLPDITGAP